MTSVFIFFSFLFPRLTLFICWLASSIPMNDTPFVLDVLAALFAPRLLIAWWMYEMHLHPALILLFAVFGILELLGGGSSTTSSSSSSKSRRD